MPPYVRVGEVHQEFKLNLFTESFQILNRAGMNSNYQIDTMDGLRTFFDTELCKLSYRMRRRSNRSVLC